MDLYRDRDPYRGRSGQAVVAAATGLLNVNPMLQYIPNHVLFSGLEKKGVPKPSSSSSFKKDEYMKGPNTISMAPSSPSLGGSTNGDSANDGSSKANKQQKKGAIPSVVLPTVPPSQFLGCRDYFHYKGSDRRRIAAMMIGVTARDCGISMNIDQEPFISFKREVRPTNLILQEELLRRAVLCNSRILPRPSQWEKDKILQNMRDHFPPQLTADDILFLGNQVKEMTEYYWKKKEKHDGEPAFNGWAALSSHLRFYHVLLKMKNDLVPALRHQGNSRFWVDATVLMNNPHWVPYSIPMPKIHPQLAQSIPLTFEFEVPLPMGALLAAFDDVRGRVRASTQHPPHIMYFLALVQREEIDATALTLPLQPDFGCIDIEVTSSNRSPSSKHKMTQPTVVNVDSATEEEEEDLQSTVASKVSQNTNPKPQPPSDLNSSFAKDVQSTTTAVTIQQPPSIRMFTEELGDELEYVDAAKLHLQQIKLFHSMECELLELEEKTLTSEGAKLRLYLDFKKRKQETIRNLKQRLIETSEFSARCSKRLRLS